MERASHLLSHFLLSFVNLRGEERDRPFVAKQNRPLDLFRFLICQQKHETSRVKNMENKSQK